MDTNATTVNNNNNSNRINNLTSITRCMDPMDNTISCTGWIPRQHSSWHL